MDTKTQSLTQSAIDEIRVEMARQRLNQHQLAKRLGWQPRYLGRRLAGEVPLTLDDLAAIAAALDATAVQLLLPQANGGIPR